MKSPRLLHKSYVMLSSSGVDGPPPPNHLSMTAPQMPDKSLPKLLEIAFQETPPCGILVASLHSRDFATPTIGKGDVLQVFGGPVSHSRSLLSPGPFHLSLFEIFHP